MKQLLNLSFLLLTVFSFKSLANTEIPKLTGPVIDKSSVLSKATISKAEQIIKEVYITSGTQLQVLIINNLVNDTIETYSMRVAETYQLGSEKKDNGILLLVAINDRKMRIEVGQGLEGKLTDSKSGRIIDQMKPYLRAGDYDGAILFAIDNIFEITDNRKILNQTKPSSIKVVNSYRARTADKEVFISIAKVFAAICFTPIVFLIGMFLGKALRSN